MGQVRVRLGYLDPFGGLGFGGAFTSWVRLVDLVLVERGTNE